NLALDRPQALDHNDDLLADAIFFDRLDLDAGERHVVHVDGIISLPYPHRGLARNFEARRARAEAMARLAPGKQLAEIDIAVKLEAGHVVASPHDRCGNAFRRQLDRN